LNNKATVNTGNDSQNNFKTTQYSSTVRCRVGRVGGKRILKIDAKNSKDFLFFWKKICDCYGKNKYVYWPSNYIFSIYQTLSLKKII